MDRFSKPVWARRVTLVALASFLPAIAIPAIFLSGCNKLIPFAVYLPAFGGIVCFTARIRCPRCRKCYFRAPRARNWNLFAAACENCGHP